MKDYSKNTRILFERLPRKKMLLFFFIGVTVSCSNFVEVDPPKNIMISETVFNDPSTVESALANLYFSMRENSLVSGFNGLTPTMAIYSDELDYFGSNPDYLEFYQNRLLATNSQVQEWWRQTYSIIYGANDIINRLDGSNQLNENDINKFKGQALFIRAFSHSLLVSVFGDIPYITTTDYEKNNMVSRTPETTVYELITEDLIVANSLLKNSEIENADRILPDQHAVKALLARIYLYKGQWELASSYASQLINSFELAELNEVFLKESSETIWQLKAGESPVNTQEAAIFIIPFINGQSYALTNDLLDSFEVGDRRKTEWLDSITDAENALTFYYPHKYKARLTVTESLEYSILFRLAEQHLIRAEARANLGDLQGALEDINILRLRANLSPLSTNSQPEILEAILRERQVELFTELGQRWFDLKRTGRANQILGAIKTNWDDTDILLPIPERELVINPNLQPQNNGY